SGLPQYRAVRTDDERAVRHQRQGVRIEDTDVVGADRLAEIVDAHHSAEGADGGDLIGAACRRDERAERRLDQLPVLQLAVEASDATAVRYDPHRVVRRASRGGRLLEHERSRVWLR